MSDVCTNCPHAVLDHDATGCMTCKCGTVFEAADPEDAGKVYENAETFLAALDDDDKAEDAEDSETE